MTASAPAVLAPRRSRRLPVRRVAARVEAEVPPLEQHSSELTRLLKLARTGDDQARAVLVPQVQASLRAIADRAMQRWDANSTLQPTALVHETYLKLFAGDLPEFADRAHFLAVSANAMRNLLVDRARARRSQRSTGDQHDPQDDLMIGFEDRTIDVLDLHAALEELAAVAPDAARVVELRFFAGTTAEEAARVMGVSTRTVEREWRAARAWLYTRLCGPSGDGLP
jgi:RNA polymerase sigma-70 factor, ECF subfamily